MGTVGFAQGVWHGFEVISGLDKQYFQVRKKGQGSSRRRDLGKMCEFSRMRGFKAQNGVWHS